MRKPSFCIFENKSPDQLRWFMSDLFKNHIVGSLMMCIINNASKWSLSCFELLAERALTFVNIFKQVSVKQNGLFWLRNVMTENCSFIQNW